MTNDNLWKINPLTGNLTLVGETGVAGLYGITQAGNNSTVYACSGSNLYTLNLQTGAATLVGPFNTGLDYMVCLAFDRDNNILYGISGWEPSLYTINTSSGAATLIGNLGLESFDPLDCAFDQSNGYLFLSAWHNEGCLFWVDTATGETWKVGDFPAGTLVSGFAIPFGAPEPPVVSISSGGILSWEPVYRAESYKIYASPDPFGAFGYLATTTNSNWSDPGFPQQKRFYQGKAYRAE